MFGTGMKNAVQALGSQIHGHILDLTPHNAPRISQFLKVLCLTL